MNNRKLVFGLMTGFVVALVMAVPVSATTTINFDDLYGGAEIGINYYELYGVNFSSDAMIAQKPDYNWVNYPPHSGDSVFYNKSGTNIQIDFASPVSKVGIWYTAFNIKGTNDATLEAYDSDDHLIGSVSGDGNTGYQDDGITPISPGTDHLVVQGSIENPNIKYIILRGTINEITYDDLEFDTAETAIPEFPTVAIPVISVIGLMFLISSRKRSE